MPQYPPIALPFFILIWVLFGFLLALIQIGVLRYVFESMGIDRRYFFSLLLLCLAGSYINIPIATLPAETIIGRQEAYAFGYRYVIPVIIHQDRTILAVNVGGAIIPVALSLFLMFKNGLYRETLIATTIVTFTVHALAKPVPGVGIAVPMFIPPLITAIVAVFIAPWRAGPLAYIAGSLGTLIGADLMNLGKVRGLGAPVASIGGAGKFDGIFLTGLVAVILAGFLAGRRARPRASDEY